MAKLAEAEYFFTEMQRVAQDPKAFRYEFSAFLSAARSVLQYALKEAQSKLGKEAGDAWYTAHLKAAPVLRFMKEVRNSDVHEQPVVPARDITIRFGGSSTSTGHFSVVNLRTGQRAESPPPEPKTQLEAVAELMPPYEPSAVIARHRVRPTADNPWNGSTDVNDVCPLYLDALRAVIVDGQTKGILTP